MSASVYRDIFGPGSRLESRFIEDYDRLKEVIDSLRSIDPTIRVVLVLGTYDLLHIGHARYMERCKELGDVVLVAVDTDIAVRRAKGSNRPIVPQEERVEMLTHLRHVDLVTLVHDYSEKGLWTYGLIKNYIRPDTIVISHRPPSDEVHIKEVEPYCGQVVVLDSQAQTSTSAKIRLLMVDFATTIKSAIESLDIPGNLARAIDTIVDPSSVSEVPKDESEHTPKGGSKW